MNQDEREPLIPDYGRPKRRYPLWFKILVIFGCILGVSIIIGIIADTIRYR
jgi:hypothetical protein